MQLETTNTTCPLCRRMVRTNGLPLSTRLCADCQALVHAIAPIGNLPAVATLAHRAGFFDDILDNEVEQIEPEDLAPEIDGRPEPLEDYKPYYIEQEPEPAEEAEDDDLDTTMEQPTRDTGPLDEPSFYYEESPQASQASEQPEQADDYGVEVNDHAAAAETEAAEGESAASADPWEEPLPAWEYSRNEWPLTAGVAYYGKRTSYRKPLIIALVLASAIGLYYFVYHPLTEDGQSLETHAPPATRGVVTSGAGENRAAARTAEPSQAPSQPATEEDEVETGTAAAVPAAGLPADDGSADGAYTLQVAALPDEASAREYSEKLMRAGISTYIVPVERGRRKFFRVRVGRFKTAEDAQKYAAQSRLRARAAGMSLDLLVVDYAK